MHRRPSRPVAALLVAGVLAVCMSGTAPAGVAAPAAKVTDVIDTVFGTGDPGTTGDGGPAVKATIDQPFQLASAPDGTLYIVTEGRIRAVDPEDGTIRTVAGTGKFGFSGDGGPATKATFSKETAAGTGLRGIAVGPDGTLYIADAGNNRVRAVDPKSGKIRTVAGSGTTDVFDGKFGGDGGPATKAHLQGPEDVAVGRDGTLYIIDKYSYRIRAVDPKTHRIRTVAGQTNPGDGGSGFFPRPADRGDRATQTFIDADAIAVGPDGTVFVAGTDDDLVRAIDVEHDKITTVADDRTPGLTGTTFFDHPTDLAVGKDGRLYVTCTAETGTNPRQNIVYALDVKKRRIQHLAGGGTQSLGDAGPAASASIGGPDHTEPMGIAVGRKGTIYVADAANSRIRAIERKKAAGRTTTARLASHDIATVVGTGRRLGKNEEEQEDDKEEGRFYRDVHPRRDVNLDFPTSVAVDSDGTIYLADTGNDRVRAVDPDSGRVRTVAGRTTQEPDLYDDRGDGGPATKAEISSPTGIALGPKRTLYIAEHGYEGAVRVVDLDDGTIDTVEGTKDDLQVPSDVAVTETGELYVAYASAPKVCVVEVGSKSCRTVADDEESGGVDAPGAFAGPTGLAIGPDGDLFIADAGSNRVRGLDRKTGDLTTVAGVAQVRVGLFARPKEPYASGDGGPATSADIGISGGIDVGPDGTLYLTDAANHRIRAVEPKTGIIRTVVGTGRYRPIRPEDAKPGANTPHDGGGFGGDGGPAGKAKLDQPQDVAVGPGGALYIVDGGNNRIRAVNAPDLPAGKNIAGWLVTGGIVVVVLLAAAWLVRWYVRRRVRRRQSEAATGPAEERAMMKEGDWVRLLVEKVGIEGLPVPVGAEGTIVDDAHAPESYAVDVRVGDRFDNIDVSADQVEPVTSPTA